jgi:anti-sigma factor RsiW
MPPLSCRELVELVTDYLENALPAAQHARFEEHIADCPGCTAYLEQMRTTIRVTHTLTEDTLDPQYKDELLNVFRNWKNSNL